MDHLVIKKANCKLRIVKCPTCKETIFHPGDLEKYKQFNNLKGKTYNVKLRIIGNSHAISIPKEIVSFIHKQEKIMDDMVQLHFEDMKKLSLIFGEQNDWKN